VTSARCVGCAMFILAGCMTVAMSRRRSFRRPDDTEAKVRVKLLCHHVANDCGTGLKLRRKCCHRGTSNVDAPACSGLATSIDRASEFVSSGRTTTSTAPGPITAACRWQVAPEALRSAGIAIDHGASPAIASAPSRPACLAARCSATARLASVPKVCISFSTSRVHGRP